MNSNIFTHASIVSAVFPMYARMPVIPNPVPALKVIAWCFLAMTKNT